MSTEDALLERFFIEPGLRGPIRSVDITDGDIVEFFETPDVESARVAFVRSLPHQRLLTALLAGEIRTPSRPDCVRVLLFLCWMQVTRLRRVRLRNFRDMLEDHLNYRVQDMTGLNALWEALARYLNDVHHIELVLPAKHPHRQIGRTLRIAFPTWRDRVALRRLRGSIVPEEQLNPLIVSNRISSAAAFANAPVSFRYNYEIWEAARLRRDVEAVDLAFWRAWLTTVSEIGGADQFEATEDEYGAIALSGVSPAGAQRPLSTISTDARFAKDLNQQIEKGLVFLEALGFGRYRSTQSRFTATLLVAPSQMADIDDRNARAIRPLLDGWNLVTFRKAPEPTGRQVSLPTSEGWVDGIRVGPGYLGRAPLAPAFKYEANVPEPHVLFGEVVVQTVSSNGKLELQSGVFDGTLEAVGTRTHKVQVLSAALEHPKHRMKGIEIAKEVPEDGALTGTWPPGAPSDLIEWPGERQAPSLEFGAIAEAVYARSARGLSLGEGIEIVGRALVSRVHAPNMWDVLRSLVDGGWIDLTTLRAYPARRIALRPLEFIRNAAKTASGAVAGPLPDRVQERLQACAEASGVFISFLPGVSEWSPRSCRVEAEDDNAIVEFCHRADLPAAAAPATAPPSDRWGEQLSLLNYQVEATWDPETGAFRRATPDAAAATLVRMVSSTESDPKLYVIQDGDSVSKFRSASLAITAFAKLVGVPAARRQGELLLRSAARVPLPASWARWVALRTGCNAGPVLEGDRWGYAHACDKVIERLLRGPLSLPRDSALPLHWDRFLMSRSRAARHVAMPSGRLARRDRAKLLDEATK